MVSHLCMPDPNSNWKYIMIYITNEHYKKLCQYHPIRNDIIISSLNTDVFRNTIKTIKSILNNEASQMEINDFETTPNAYKNQLRLDYAKHLLLEKDKLSDVSVMSGFYDQAHFTREFKK